MEYPDVYCNKFRSYLTGFQIFVSIKLRAEKGLKSSREVEMVKKQAMFVVWIFPLTGSHMHEGSQ